MFASTSLCIRRNHSRTASFFKYSSIIFCFNVLHVRLDFIMHPPKPLSYGFILQVFVHHILLQCLACSPRLHYASAETTLVRLHSSSIRPSYSASMSCMFASTSLCIRRNHSRTASFFKYS